MIEVTAGSAAEWLATLPPGLALLYKHSPRCGMSYDAVEEVRRFAAAHPMIPVYRIDVLAQRELARELARALNVNHHSPQVILLSSGQVRWHTSHHRIRSADLSARVAT